MFRISPILLSAALILCAALPLQAQVGLQGANAFAVNGSDPSQQANNAVCIAVPGQLLFEVTSSTPNAGLIMLVGDYNPGAFPSPIGVIDVGSQARPFAILGNGINGSGGGLDALLRADAGGPNRPPTFSLGLPIDSSYSGRRGPAVQFVIQDANAPLGLRLTEAVDLCFDVDPGPFSPSSIQGRVEQLPPRPLSIGGFGDLVEHVGPQPYDIGFEQIAQGGHGLSAPKSPIPWAPSQHSHSIHVGLLNGEARLAVTDLQVPSVGFPFNFARVYNSRANFDAGLGYNWDYVYNRRIKVLSSTKISVANGLGREDTYTWTGNGCYAAPAGIFDFVKYDSATGTWWQIDPGGNRYDFDSSGYLVGMVDRAGNVTAIERNTHHRPLRIIDTQGRRYDFAMTDGSAAQNYDDGTPGQRIASITDFDGRSVVFSYDSRGDLVKVRSPIVVGTPTGNDFPLGKTTLYTYSSGYFDSRLNHNLIEVIEPAYNVNDDPSASTAKCRITYSTTTNPYSINFDRVVAERWGNDQGGPPQNPNIVVGGTRQLAYTKFFGGDQDAPAGAFQRTTDTDYNGNRRKHYFANNGVLLKTLEETNRNIRPGEGNYAWSFGYNSDGLLTAMTMPRGNRVSYVYDSQNPERRAQANLLEIRHETLGLAGGGPDLITRYTFEPVYNQLRSVTDPRAFPSGTVPTDANGHLDLNDPLVATYTTLFLYDYQEGSGFQALMGVPSSELIPEGLGDLNGFSDHNAGNLVRIVYPTIQTPGPNAGDTAKETRAFNKRGQLISLTDQRGSVTSFDYYADNGIPQDASDLDGYLFEVVRDAGPGNLNLTHRYGYDQVGNMIWSLDPKGQRVDYIVNALNQTVRRLSRPVDGNIRYTVDYIYDANDLMVARTRVNLDDKGQSYAHGKVTDSYEYDILHYKRAQIEDKTRNDGSDAGVVRTEFVYDANMNLSARLSPLAVAGVEARNVYTNLFDERNLLFRSIEGDDDLDASNGAPSDAVVMVYNYDGNGNTIEIIDSIRDAQSPLAPVTQFPGSAAGDILAYEYDGHDRRKAIVNEEGNRWETTYDANSKVISRRVLGALDAGASAAFGRMAQVDYVVDEIGRRVLQHQHHFETATGTPIGDGRSTMTYTYDAENHVVATTDDRGQVTTTAFDGADRRILTTDALGNTVAYAYDANDNVISETRSEISGLAGQTETFVSTAEYDGLDRLTRETNAGGGVTEYFRDSRHHVVRSSDAKRGSGHPNGPGNIIEYEFDALGRLREVRREMTDNGRGDGSPVTPIVTNRIWDDNSRLIAQVDDEGNRTDYVFDELNRMRFIDYADGSRRTANFDAEDRISQWTDQNGTVCVYGYDGANRRISHFVAPGAGVVGSTLELFGYDGMNRIVRAENNDGLMAGTMTCIIGWDSLSLHTIDDQMGKVVSAEFDGNGNRISCVYPGAVGGGPARSLSLGYDALDRLASIDDAGGRIASLNYRGAWRLDQRSYGPAAAPVSTLEMGWDALPRVNSMRHERGSDGSRIAEFEYGYDRMHNRRFERRLHDSVQANFSYDSIYRVVGESDSAIAIGGPIQPFPILPVSPNSVGYEYDGIGNRERVTRSNSGNTVYSMSAGDVEVNQYSSAQTGAGVPELFGYDANGNLTADRNFRYEYDFKNRLVRVRELATTALVAEYSYDGFNRRVGKIEPSGTTHYVYDGDICIEERDDSGSVTRQYVWGTSIGELYQMSSTDGVFWAHENSIGSICALSDASGALVERYRYDAYGVGRIQVVAGQSASGNEYRYQGSRLDPETGHYHMINRSYSPALGRFLQRDPIGVWTDFINLGNGYSFVGNNPVNRVDPFGLQGVGHHYVPRQVWGKGQVSDAAKKVFDGATTGPTEPRHGWSKEHKTYNEAVKKDFDSYCKEKGIDPKKMTDAQAKEFLDGVKNSDNPDIKNFNDKAEKQAKEKAAKEAAEKAEKEAAEKAAKEAAEKAAKEAAEKAAEKGAGKIIKKGVGAACRKIPGISVGFFVYDWCNGGVGHAANEALWPVSELWN